MRLIGMAEWAPKAVKRSRLPFREAAQWRSFGTGTSAIRRGGVPDRVDIAEIRRQRKIIGGNRRSGCPALDRRRLGRHRQISEKRWQAEPGKDQGAEPGKAERVGQGLARRFGSEFAGFQEHGHPGPPMQSDSVCSVNVLN